MKKYLKDGRTTSHGATIYGQMCGCRCWWKMLNNPWRERSQNGKGKSQKKKEKKKDKKSREEKENTYHSSVPSDASQRVGPFA